VRIEHEEASRRFLILPFDTVIHFLGEFVMIQAKANLRKPLRINVGTIADDF
jgi:hypothetical protein